MLLRSPHGIHLPVSRRTWACIGLWVALVAGAPRFTFALGTVAWAAPPSPESSTGVARSAGSASPAPPAPNSSAVGPVVTDPPPVPTNRVLRVGAAGSAPFVINDGGTVRGLSVDVWRALAARLGLKYEFVPTASIPEGIDDVAARKLDVLVGPISITASRAMRVDFTQAYFMSQFGIASLPDTSTLWQRVGPFLSKAFFFGASSLLFTLAGVGALIWFVERRKNPEMFPKAPLKGIANGVWMALVTMTTVGYGDRVPVTLAGRVVTGVWMVIAMLSVSSLTAGIATTLTLAQLQRGQIESLHDLRGRRVAVLDNTVGEEFALASGAHVRKVATVAEAFDLVKRGTTDAVLHDRPILQFYIGRHDDVEFFLSPGVSASQGYGFAVADHDLDKQLTISLLAARESGELGGLTRKWLGE